MAEYIERQAVLSEYDRQHKGPPGGARRIIETFPAADVRPVVRGKWESHGEGFKWVYICSACGYVDGYPMNERMHFCPNCGAMMEGNDGT